MLRKCPKLAARAVMGINLDTLRPEPCVEGHTTPGGYSSKAVKPIALAKVRLPLCHCLDQNRPPGRFHVGPRHKEEASHMPGHAWKMPI